MTDERIKTGDTVFHRPTGETWLVAYADYERGDLAWVGWPPGWAEIGDCELRESCSDEKSLELLKRLSRMRGDRQGYDHRKSWALHELEKRETSNR